MADDYGELVELGFEGIDRITDKYHDTVYGYATKHKPKFPGSKKKHNGRGPPPDSPPHHSQDREAPRSRSEPPDDTYGDSDPYPPRKDREDRGMYEPYAPDRRRDSDRRDDGGYERTAEDREYQGYAPRGGQEIAMRDRDPYGYPSAVIARPPPPPPPQYGYPEPYGDAWAARGRPMPSRQRSSSWSPPRRSDQRRHASPHRRVRSKSPNHHRVVATIVGALAGGVAGSRLKKGEAVPNTISTVAGAVIGGLGAREVEKQYDRHKDRKLKEEEEEDERRERRRERRERRYS